MNRRNNSGVLTVEYVHLKKRKDRILLSIYLVASEAGWRLDTAFTMKFCDVALSITPNAGKITPLDHTRTFLRLTRAWHFSELVGSRGRYGCMHACMHRKEGGSDNAACDSDD